MSKQFVFVNTDGLYEEATAYETADFISTSAGAGDAGKPIVLDAAGHIDASMINDADIDHGSIGGLGDDDHTQYTLADGTRAFTGDQSMGGNQLTSVGDPVTTTIDGASDDAVPMSFLASTSNGEGASVIGVEDTGGYYTNTDVEAVLQEVGAQLAAGLDYVEYTVGAGGVTKGDLVYISANDTVLPYSTLTDVHRGIGLANSTESAAATVQVSANDEVIAGVLTTATAGTPYYWDGSTLSTSIPSGSGSHVWQAGVAKNATDLHVEVRYIKKNI
jgi:hypothetical protein